MADSIGRSNLFSAICHGFCELLIFRIDVISASPLSRIVDLRFLEEPIAAFHFVALLFDISDQTSGAA